jgi:hypothetical protein
VVNTATNRRGWQPFTREFSQIGTGDLCVAAEDRQFRWQNVELFATAELSPKVFRCRSEGSLADSSSERWQEIC